MLCLWPCIRFFLCFPRVLFSGETEGKDGLSLCNQSKVPGARGCVCPPYTWSRAARCSWVIGMRFHILRVTSWPPVVWLCIRISCDQNNSSAETMTSFVLPCAMKQTPQLPVIPVGHTAAFVGAIEKVKQRDTFGIHRLDVCTPTQVL